MEQRAWSLHAGTEPPEMQHMLAEGMNADEVLEVMQGDPFVQNGVFLIEDCADWTVYVDPRAESQ